MHFVTEHPIITSMMLIIGITVVVLFLRGIKRQNQASDNAENEKIRSLHELLTYWGINFDDEGELTFDRDAFSRVMTASVDSPYTPGKIVEMAMEKIEELDLLEEDCGLQYLERHIYDANPKQVMFTWLGLQLGHRF